MLDARLDDPSAVFELLHETAEAEGIPFTVGASGRVTGTDADAIHIARAGIPTGLVSCRCATCTRRSRWCQLDDVENAAKLIAAFAMRLSADLDFRR